MNLPPDHLHTARIIGLTESVAQKFMSGKPFKPELEKIVNKFFFTLILNDLWTLKPVAEVAISYNVSRGVVQNLMGAAAICASSILKLCEELEEFWAFKGLLQNLTQRLSYCCSMELMPLMQLPSVKLARAKQLYNAGFKKLEDVARATSRELVNKIEHLSDRNAKQLISAAKVFRNQSFIRRIFNIFFMIFDTDSPFGKGGDTAGGGPRLLRHIIRSYRGLEFIVEQSDN